MAVPSFIKPLWSERRINQHHGFSIPEVQQPSESTKGALPAPRPDAIPLATLAQFAQFLAHDFRHHLSTVYANAEFLCGRTIHSVDKDDLLGEIRSAIGCMTDQLDSLLLCTRTGHTMQPRRESLRSIIDQAVQLVRSHPETRHVTFIQHDIPALEGWLDGTMLCSAVFNLLLNACQAANVAAEVKWVDVDLHQGSSYVLVRVSDSGPGVSDAIRETLFHPFVKAEDTKGMGLGLTIARCIAQEHGGEVYLEESRPGKTVFALTLPTALFCCRSISRA